MNSYSVITVMNVTVILTSKLFLMLARLPSLIS